MKIILEQIISLLVELVESIFTFDEQKEFYRSRWFEGANIFLLAASNKDHEEIFFAIIKYLLKVFEGDEFRSLFVKQDGLINSLLNNLFESIYQSYKKKIESL